MPETIEAPAAENVGVDNPAFGNLSEAFDAAFPATAPEEGAEPTPEQAPVAPAPGAPKSQPAAPEKPAEATDPHEVPESIFGDAPKPDAAKPVEAPEPEIVMPKSITKAKDIATWEALRTAYHTTKTELAKEKQEFARQIEEAKKAPSDEGARARIAELENYNRQLSDRVASVNVQAHPAFQAKFEQPRRNLLGHAANLLKTVDKDPTALERAMSLTGKQRIEALDDFYSEIESPTVRGKVSLMVDQIDQIDAEKSNALADSYRTLEGLTKHDVAEKYRQQEIQTEQMAKTFDSAVEHLREKAGFEVLKQVEGAPWWNEQGEKALAAARRLMFETEDPSEMATAAVLAATSGIHRGLWLKERETRIARDKELKEIKGAEPDLGGRNDRPTGDDEGDANLTFAERVARGSGLR